MPNNLDDDELIRLTSESERISDRLDQLYEREAAHKSLLGRLDDANEGMVHNIADMTKQLNRAVKGLQSSVQERTELADELNNLPGETEQTANQLRTVKRKIMDGIEPEVCPQCGSTDIATILYGYPVEDPDGDHSESKYVMGGCQVDPDLTVSCLNCGESFLDNFEKWKRAKMSREQEIVFEVGAEGGALTIVRQRNQLATWEYWSIRDETTMADVLSDESIDPDLLFEKSVRQDSFEDALRRLDKYPWFLLYPLKVHPDFADLVLREVKERGGKKAAVKWTETLKRNMSRF